MILQNFRNLVWADYILYALTDPRELYRRIHSGNGNLALASFAVPLTVCLLDILALAVQGTETGFFYYKISYGWILVFLYEFLKIIIYSAMIDAASQLQGFKGNITEIITLVNFSMIPQAFLLPCVYFFSMVNFAPAFFYILAAFMFYIWYVLILVQGISEMNSTGFGKALAVYILPAMLIGVVLFFIFFLVVMMAAGFMMGL